MRRYAALAATSLLTAIVLAAQPGEAVPIFGSPVRVGGSGYEPGIDISQAGTLFVNQPGSGHPVWRSIDGGASWKRITITGNPNRYPGGFDNDIAAGHGKHVYMLDLSVASSTLLRSDDDGLTWTQGTPFSTLPLTDREWVAVGKQDPTTGAETVYAVYEFIQPPSQVMFARSRDSGITWDYHAAVPSVLGSTGFVGQLVANDDGFVAFTTEDAGKQYLVRSTDEGNTWKKIMISWFDDSFGSITGLALDGNTLHAVWISTVWNYSVQYSRSDDLGVTWSYPVTVSPEGSNMFPWVAAQGNKVSVAWYGSNLTDRTNPNNAADETTWHVGYAESLDGGVTFGEPIEAFDGPVQLGHICTNGIGCMSGRELGDFMQLLIDHEGMAVIVYGSNKWCPCGNAVVKQIA